MPRQGRGHSPIPLAKPPPARRKKKPFDVGRTPAQLAKLSLDRIDDLIHAATFHRPKAQTIRDIARRVADDFDGHLPCDLDTLLTFKGAGPKCSTCPVLEYCRQIGVDKHR